MMLQGSGIAALAGLVVAVALLAATAEASAPIDGNWSPWGKLMTSCIDPDTKEEVLCGGGKRIRYRSCTNPRPSGTGSNNCTGENSEEIDCNTHACQLPGHFLWSAWSQCSTDCGRGTQSRYTLCGSIRYRADGALVNQRPSKRKKRGVPISEYSQENATLFELEHGEACQAEQKKDETRECNTWNKAECPPACKGVECPSFAVCMDKSTDEDPGFQCECQLGTKMKDDGSACIEPPPTTPTPRPIPTLPAAQKVVSTVITRGASTLIIVFLGVTLVLFLVMRIFDASRVIHMNMEIALICAHICLMPSVHEDNPELCRVLSILIHYFHVACFMFMLLESIHMYSLVSWVVTKDGMLTKAQNVIFGWGVSFVIILFNLCFLYDDYGGQYHCWLQMDTGLFFGQYMPLIAIAVLTLAIVEAAGAADTYEKLDETDKSQRLTAKIMQRTLFFILVLVMASYVLGTNAEYMQDMYLYSIFTLVNGILGFFVFFFHCSANETVRSKLAKFGRKICPRKSK